MKHLIQSLFAIAAISACIVPQAHAEIVKTWMMVAVLLENGTVTGGRVFATDSHLDCETKRVQLGVEAAAAKVEVFSQCVEVTGEKVLGDPKTKQKS